MEITINTYIPAKPLKRIAAFFIDYAVIAVYIIGLFFLSMLINQFWPIHQMMEGSYLFRHLISFCTLTMPVIIYFISMERSNKHATVGKALLKLKVANTDGGEASLKQLTIRNIIKFIPWEIAHAVIHFNYAALLFGNEMDIGLMIGLLVPQLVALGYIIMIFLRDDSRSLYEILSGTRVLKTHHP